MRRSRFHFRQRFRPRALRWPGLKKPSAERGRPSSEKVLEGNGRFECKSNNDDRPGYAENQNILVDVTGIEPVTPCLQSSRQNTTVLVLLPFACV
jgi:hypothetical protein